MHHRSDRGPQCPDENPTPRLIRLSAALTMGSIKARRGGMQLNGKQLRVLHGTMVDCFDKSELERLCRFDLDTDLDQVVNNDGPLRDIVFELIGWANRSGRIGDLIRA